MAGRKSYAPSDDDGKSTIMLIGVLLVLIVVVGAGLMVILSPKTPSQPPPVQNQTPPPVQNLTNVTEVCDDECMLAKAIDAKDPQMCGELTEGDIQPCYEALATDSLDACLMVADASKSGECVTGFAVAGGNMTLCDSLGGDARTSCREAVDPCAEADAYELCRAIGSEDPSFCEGEQECLVDYSMYQGTTSSCDMIANRVVAAACKSAVLSSDRCYDLGPGSLRDYCYELFAIYSGDYLTCTQIDSDSVYAIDCYSLYAVDSGNHSVCGNNGLSLDSRWKCYTNYSLISGDKGGCAAIPKLASTNKFRCAFEFAKLHGDPSACGIIEDSGSRSTCYEGSIIYSNENLDWRNCAGISNYNWRNKCYTEAAKLESDASICDNIQESAEREGCKSALAG
ncbi:MAG: hypothetical protein AB1295_05155 [Candidatus Micrarchaeota archaeon]